jgi:hypothetical protein
MMPITVNLEENLVADMGDTQASSGYGGYQGGRSRDPRIISSGPDPDTCFQQNLCL